MTLKMVLAAAALLIVALGLRLHDLDRFGLWYDEGTTLGIAAGWPIRPNVIPQQVLVSDPPDLTQPAPGSPWYRSWTQMSGDVHPPVFFITLRLWRAVVGDGDAAMRMLSVTCSIASIVLLFLLGRALANARVGLWASAIAIVAPTQIMYARELRGYAMAALFTIALMLVAELIVRKGPSLRRGLTLGLCAALCLLTHYFTLGIVMATTAYLLVSLRGRDRAWAVGCLVASTCAAAAAWGPMFVSQVHAARQSSSWLTDPEASGHVTRVLSLLGEAPLRLIAQPFRVNLLVVFTLFIFLLIIPAVQRDRAMMLPWLAFVGSLLFPLSMDLVIGTLSLEWIRFSLMAAAPMFLLIAGIGDVVSLRIARHALPAVAALFGLVSLPLTYEQRGSDYREMVSAIASHAKAGEPVVYYSVPPGAGFHAPAEIMYLCTSRYLGAAHPIAICDGPPAPTLLAQLQEYETIWVVKSSAADAPAAFTGFRASGLGSWDMTIGAAERYQRTPSSLTDAQTEK